jgi:hypothetical protein
MIEPISAGGISKRNTEITNQIEDILTFFQKSSQKICKSPLRITFQIWGEEEAEIVRWSDCYRRAQHV